MNNFPRIPEGVTTPCQNEEVSGRHTETSYIDLFFGSNGSDHHTAAAYEEATHLCNTVCPKEAFDACLAYKLKEDPAYGVWGGKMPKYH